MAAIFPYAIHTTAAPPAREHRLRGAKVPFREYEAEDAGYFGKVIGPSRTFSDIAAEASGRKAVRLEGQGSFVEFELASSANALTVRTAVPDTSDGRGQNVTLGVYVDTLTEGGGIDVGNRFGM